jgi:tetratricopeptide (TPR) repeat protein
LLIRKKKLEADHPDLATTYNNLGLVNYTQGKYEESERYTLLCLEIRKKVLGADHPDLATTYNNLGLLYLDQKKYKEAEQYTK